MRHEEDRLQIACRTWFDCQYPKLRLLLHHSPNEGRLTNPRAGGAKRKAMGVRAGFPDFILLKPSHGYAYLAIELKAPRGRQSPSQRDYQAAVEREGGRYIICRSLDDFRREVGAYLTERPQPQKTTSCKTLLTGSRPAPSRTSAGLQKGRPGRR